MPSSPCAACNDIHGSTTESMTLFSVLAPVRSSHMPLSVSPCRRSGSKLIHLFGGGSRSNRNTVASVELATCMIVSAAVLTLVAAYSNRATVCRLHEAAEGGEDEDNEAEKTGAAGDDGGDDGRCCGHGGCGERERERQARCQAFKASRLIRGLFVFTPSLARNDDNNHDNNAQ
jgi:hypothetical protein